MSKDIKLREFLAKLAICSGDEAIAIISDFQSGALSIEGIHAHEVEDEQ